jgi:hypothetical protein
MDSPLASPSDLAPDSSTIIYVGYAASSLGILGSLYVIATYFVFFRRKSFGTSLIFWNAVNHLFLCIGLFVVLCSFHVCSPLSLLRKQHHGRGKHYQSSMQQCTDIIGDAKLTRLAFSCFFFCCFPFPRLPFWNVAEPIQCKVQGLFTILFGQGVYFWSLTFVFTFVCVFVLSISEARYASLMVRFHDAIPPLTLGGCIWSESNDIYGYSRACRGFYHVACLHSRWDWT